MEDKSFKRKYGKPYYRSTLKMSFKSLIKSIENRYTHFIYDVDVISKLLENNV